MNLNVTLFAQAITFFLFIIVSVKWVWPMVLKHIEARQKIIADGLAEAERGRSSLAEAQKQNEITLREARTRAQEIVAAAEKAASQRIEESKSQATAEGDRLVAAAKASIEQDVQSARQQTVLSGEVVRALPAARGYGNYLAAIPAIQATGFNSGLATNTNFFTARGGRANEGALHGGSSQGGRRS